MTLRIPTCLRLAITLVVVGAFWLFGTGKVEAGCGDHGYVVQRANGEVVVVTPSNSQCPCKGPKCQKPEVPPTPFVPVTTLSVLVDDAWQQAFQPGNRVDSGMIVWPVHLQPVHDGNPADILHPPRA